MLFYEAYGYSIYSEIELPLAVMPSLNGEPDLVVRFGKADEDSGGVVREIPDLFAFCINYDGEIIVEVYDQARIRLIASIIRGEIVSAFLRWQGYLVLHASAVSIDGKAIAFMGWSGAGKSVSALSFLNHIKSCKLITDDILPVKVLGDKILAIPSFPRARLWGKEHKLISDVKVESSSVHEASDKKEFTLKCSFAKVETPLDSLFILNGYNEDGNIVINSIDKLGALKFIVSQTWSRGIIGDNRYEDQDLQNVGRLVNTVDIFKLRRVDDIDKTHLMVEAVLRKRGLLDK
jgi:hypothetical protein